MKDNYKNSLRDYVPFRRCSWIKKLTTWHLEELSLKSSIHLLINDPIKSGKIFDYRGRRKSFSQRHCEKSFFSAIWSWKRLKSLPRDAESTNNPVKHLFACLFALLFMSFMCMGVEKFLSKIFLTRFLYRCYFFSQKNNDECLRQLFVERKGKCSSFFHFDQLRDVFCTFLTDNVCLLQILTSLELLKFIFPSLSLECVPLWKPKDIMTSLSAIFFSHMLYFYLFFIYIVFAPFFASRLGFINIWFNFFI